MKTDEPACGKSIGGTPLHRERMRRFVAAGIYLVTSESLSGGRTTVDIVAAALDAGVRLIQLREKEMPVRPFMDLAVRVRKLTAERGALLIVNDRLDVALSVGADGVHLGQDDFPIPAARRLAPDMILGASTHSVAEARRAQEEGASYINIGPLYSTTTKEWSGRFLGLEGLREIAAVARVPYTVMGGIKSGHLPALVSAGVRTVAVVTAITAAADPREAARRLLAFMR